MIDPLVQDYSFTPVSPQRPSFGYQLADLAAQPFVTIVTPFFNTGVIFHETARSVLGQSLQQFEWLIYNDRSTEPEALAVLDEYRAKDPRIRVIDLPENVGQGAARNIGFRAARAQYVALLDSDDLLEPTALEKWFWFLESYPEYSFVKGYSVGFGASNYLWDRGFHNGKEFLDDNLIDIASLMRKTVHQTIGGYDETARVGLEDWEFWLHCANAGYWGDTIPEYLNWYRRRPDHTDRWPLWDEGEKQRVFRKLLKERYPRLWDHGFPQIARRKTIPNDMIPDVLPCENRLNKNKPRLLMIVPWLTTGGADKFNLDLVKQLTGLGWEVTIATTVFGDTTWLPQFARYTPDIFVLSNFLHLADHPRFLRYLISSRQIDVVMISHSEMGYLLLPYLRAHFPAVTFIDCCHIVEEYWKNGGYPRMAVEYQEQLDMNVVASQQVKDWMVTRGADPQRINVCYINVDPEEWRRDPDQRASVRRDLGLNDELPMILFAGRLLPQKQPNVFANTMLKLKQRGLKFLAVVAGDGPDFEWLQSFIKDRGLAEHIRLLGVVSNQRIKGLMAAADIFFLPSRWEGIALVIYEAMASGVLVVGADVGGQRELLTPECGVLINLADEETQVQRYSDVLADFLANPEKRLAMGRAARERVSTFFPLDQMGKRMTVLLAEARKEHESRPPAIPGLGLGRAIASQAVEYTRLYQVADQLWSERYSSAAVVLGRNRLNWRAQLYANLYRWHEPIYRRYSKLGFAWLTPVREKIRQLLLR